MIIQGRLSITFDILRNYSNSEGDLLLTRSFYVHINHHIHSLSHLAGKAFKILYVYLVTFPALKEKVTKKL